MPRPLCSKQHGSIDYTSLTTTQTQEIQHSKSLLRSQFSRFLSYNEYIVKLGIFARFVFIKFANGDNIKHIAKIVILQMPYKRRPKISESKKSNVGKQVICSNKA